jgi:hypothetical protein
VERKRPAEAEPVAEERVVEAAVERERPAEAMSTDVRNVRSGETSAKG